MIMPDAPKRTREAIMQTRKDLASVMRPNREKSFVSIIVTSVVAMIAEISAMRIIYIFCLPDELSPCCSVGHGIRRKL